MDFNTPIGGLVLFLAVTGGITMLYITWAIVNHYCITCPRCRACVDRDLTNSRVYVPIDNDTYRHNREAQQRLVETSKYKHKHKRNLTVNTSV